MSGTPFTLVPYLTSIAVAYKNKALIADQVLPRVRVGSQLFEYFKFNQADQFTIPDTKVGRTSAPGQVEFGGTNAQASTFDYALDSPVPEIDKQNAAAFGLAGFDPEARAATNVTALIHLDRESRVASMVFNASNYASANKTTLTNAWNDFTLGDPLGDLTTALDSMLMRANILVLGRKAASAIQRNPQFVEAFYGNAATSGIVPFEFIRNLLGLDLVVVGEAYKNTANPGQAQTNARLWDTTKAALLYRDSVASADSGTSFGFTAQFGEPVAGRIIDPDMGMRGGVRVRSGESVKEVITANDLGYLFSNAST